MAQLFCRMMAETIVSLYLLYNVDVMNHMRGSGGSVGHDVVAQLVGMWSGLGGSIEGM